MQRRGRVAKKVGAENYDEYDLLEREKPKNCSLVHAEYDQTRTEYWIYELTSGTEDLKGMGLIGNIDRVQHAKCGQSQNSSLMFLLRTSNDTYVDI